MAGIILAGVGASVGASVGGAVLGISSAVIGQAVGAIVGSAIDQWLFAPTIRSSQEGPRLSEANVMTASEGANVYRGYGRFKVAGNVIWASRLFEDVVTDTVTTGGKGGGGTSVETTTYNYYANFAVGLCEGEIMQIHRVWADGKLLDLSEIDYYLYTGTEDQLPDETMETKDGVGNVPAYRGLAYVVFKDLLINDFGNRIPQMAFEVTRHIKRSDNNSVADLIVGVDLIPGTSELGLDPEVIEQVFYEDDEIVERSIENAHSGNGNSDWNEALDQLAINLPNCNIITFVVTWFGTDLRIGNCEIIPKVENDTKRTDPISWHVAGLDRGDAVILSEHDGGPAFGGSPNDASIYRAIIDLKARGYEVMFYPFIIMDIESGNSLPNPYSNNAADLGQSVYPWRGRITCSPAAGYTGSVDKTATARTQVDAFLGTADAADFSGTEGEVLYSGASEWSFNRFVLHMAEVCRQAGGVDYFCIGTEMVGPSTIRDNNNDFPFVEGLITLAAEVTSMLPTTKIGYASDWSEYHSYRPADGTGDVYFHLDPLWSDANIDFIGIDNYMKLSDWRDTSDHADYGTGLDAYGRQQGTSIYDLEYLKGQVAGGEDYDYFYASSADRASQTRTDITDGAHGKPWVYRQKDLVSWWQNNHVNRPGGVEAGGNTSWVPESKPIIFTEYGCPAVNKGTNQPNVFYDPKSSESFVPYFSSGGRDDEIQRQYIRAFVEHWNDNANNPASGSYSGRMVDTDRMNYWSYDARPWPTFPVDGDTWADQANWQYGHWISGRIDTVFMPDLLEQLAEDYGLTMDYDFSRAYGSCDGFILAGKTSFRSAVEPLSSVFLFDIIESGDKIKAVSQQETQSVLTVDGTDLADMGAEEPVTLVDKPSHELPKALTIKFLDIFNNYEQAAVSQRRESEVVDSEAEPSSDVPIVIDYARAHQMVDKLLYSAWAKRTSAEFGVLPQYLALEAGDVVTVDDGHFNESFRLQTVTDSGYRALSALSFDPGIFQPGGGASRTQAATAVSITTAPIIAIMDLPLLQSSDTAYQPYVAAYANPWQGTHLFKSITDSGYALDTTVLAPTIMGFTTDPFDVGPTGVWDDENELRIKIFSGSLESLEDALVLNSRNALAIENSAGGWEILQFGVADPTDIRTYTLTHLLRGQLGTEDSMEASLPAGARVVVLQSTLQQMSTGLGDLGREYYYKYGPSNRDIGDDTYNTIQRTVNGRGLKPYSPVHVDSTTDAGDITISWVRRTRINGDSWDYTDDVPLNEAYEKYQVDVLDGGGTVLRTLSVTDATEVVYTAAQQSADGISTPFEVDVYQMSDQVGRGTARRATING